MNPEVASLWARARKALFVAEKTLSLDPNTAASRAYYAAFYAVSARFARDDWEFVKHTAVKAAVHRDLVNTGLWPAHLGQDYSNLASLRIRGDYGTEQEVTAALAAEGIEAARRILQAVSAEDPANFPLSE